MLKNDEGFWGKSKRCAMFSLCPRSKKEGEEFYLKKIFDRSPLLPSPSWWSVKNYTAHQMRSIVGRIWKLAPWNLHNRLRLEIKIYWKWHPTQKFTSVPFLLEWIKGWGSSSRAPADQPRRRWNINKISGTFCPVIESPSHPPPPTHIARDRIVLGGTDNKVLIMQNSINHLRVLLILSVRFRSRWKREKEV